MSRFLLMLVLAVPVAWSQDVYRFTDEEGRPVFTDQAPPAEKEAERIRLPDPGEVADAEERLERINETASMLRDDREAREETRANRRREAREERHAREAAETAERPAGGGGGWYGPWRPGYGPGWHPGHRPGYRPRPPYHRPEHPIYRPPELYPRPQPPGGALRGVGPEGRGW